MNEKIETISTIQSQIKEGVIMHSVMKKIGILTILALFSILAPAQEGMKIKFIPPQYIKPHEGEKVSEAQASSELPWVVYSDRSGNKTYSSSTGLSTLKTLEFLQYFYVVEEKDDWIRIFKEAEGTEGSFTLSKNAVDYGWVKKENMLLWRRCLYTNKDVSKKAMLLNTMQSVQTSIKKGEAQVVKFYKDPRLVDPTDKQSSIFSIFYIYKLFPDVPGQAPTAALLGMKEYTGGGGIVTDEIWGWVDFKRITPWDHRVSILPNIDPTAFAERKKANIKATVLIDVQNATNFQDNKPVPEPLIYWKENQYRPTFLGTYMRFPVLWDAKKIEENKGIMKVGVMGEVQGAETTVNSYAYAEVQSKINTSRKQSKNINLVFVVDGTSSMTPYFPKIAEAIVQVMKQLDPPADKVIGKNSYRFGAVVYRDKEEGEGRVTQVFALTSNVNEIANNLQGVQAGDLKDKDAEEAMFFGIKTAVRALSVPEDQTNYLILIGDAGSHTRQDDTQVPMQEIVDLLAKYSFNFLAFQVHNPGGNNAFSEFVRQNRDIVDQVSQKAYQKVKNVAAAAGGKVPNPPKQRMDAASHKYVMDNAASFGSVYFAIPGQRVAPETLKKEIIFAVSAAADSTNVVLEAVNKAAYEGKSIQVAIDDANKKAAAKATSIPNSDKVDFFASGVWLAIEKAGISPDQMKILLDEHYQMYMPGYTSLRKSNFGSNLWQYDLFYTNDEFFELKKSFEKLTESSTAPQRRKLFAEAWRQLLTKSLGEKGTEENLSKTIEEVERMVFGLPGTSEFLKLTLADLEDPAKFSNEKLSIWQINIERKLKKLNSIWNNAGGNEKEFSFDSNDNRYFWVPQTFLP